MGTTRERLGVLRNKLDRVNDTFTAKDPILARFARNAIREAFRDVTADQDNNGADRKDNENAGRRRRKKKAQRQQDVRHSARPRLRPRKKKRRR